MHRPSARASRAVLIAVAAVLLISAGLRLWHLGQPHDFIFDEIYYAKDAHAIIHGQLKPSPGPYPWEPGKEISWPHPEWGKLAIAGGIELFGYNPFGRRIASAVAGLALLTLVYPLARRFGLAPRWALAALILAAADPLGLAQSRIATLDVFVALWTVLCIYLALRYVQDGHRARWLWAAGLAGGLAFGTKWSGALACLAALVLVALAAWLGRARRRRPEAAYDADRDAAGEDVFADAGEDVAPEIRGPAAGRPAFARVAGLVVRAAPPLAALVLLPAALYVASYFLYFAAGHSWAQWWELQHQMWTFNLHLKAKHTYASSASTWIVIGRPVWYYFQARAGKYYGIVAIGNPLLWWASILALAALPIVALYKRQWLPALPSLVVAILYLPWFGASRTSFLYYMTPVAPFLAIALAAALAQLAGEAGEWQAPGWMIPLDDGVGPPRGRGAAFVPAALLAAAAAVTALAWHPLAVFAADLFWHRPEQAARHLGWVTAAVGICAAAGATITISVSSHRTAFWRRFAWVYVGLVVGIAVIYLPIILGIGITPAHYYRLMWFPRWI